jgi:hypothetical protein
VAGLPGALVLLALLALPGAFAAGEVVPTTTQLLIEPVTDAIPPAPDFVTTSVNVTYSFFCAPTAGATIVQLRVEHAPSWLVANLSATALNLGSGRVDCAGQTVSQSRAVLLTLSARPEAPPLDRGELRLIADAPPNAPLAGSQAQESMPIQAAANGTALLALLKAGAPVQSNTTVGVAAADDQDDRVPSLGEGAMLALLAGVALAARRR